MRLLSLSPTHNIIVLGGEKMDCEKIGSLIYKMRKETNLTQKELADQLSVSDKTISKWERGQGCPDISLLPKLSELFHLDMEQLLLGSLQANEESGGNMKKIKFYVCPECGNIITSSAPASVSCCGRKLEALTPKKSEGDHQLSVEEIDGQFYVSSEHEMTKEHYISFTAYVTGEQVLLTKHYPEWALQKRFPKMGRGILYFYCVEEGLFYQYL